MRWVARSCATPAWPWSRWRTATRSSGACSPGSRRATADGWTSRSRASSWTCGSVPRRSPRRTRRRGRWRGRTSPTSAPLPKAAAWTSTTCSCGRSRPCARTSACLHAGGGARSACSWTRRRTWTGRSWSWCCCSPPLRTTSSLSATTTRRSTPGASQTCGGYWGWRRPSPGCGAWTLRPTTAARRRSWSARCAWSSTTASGSPSGSWRARDPAAVWSWHRTPRTMPCGSAAGWRRGPRMSRPGRCSRGRTASCSWPWSRHWSCGCRSEHPTSRSRSRTRGWTSCWRGRPARPGATRRSRTRPTHPATRFRRSAASAPRSSRTKLQTRRTTRTSRRPPTLRRRCSAGPLHTPRSRPLRQPSRSGAVSWRSSGGRTPR